MLIKLNTTTDSFVVFSTPALNEGRGIIVDSDENVYAVYSKNNLMVKYDKNGNELNRSSTCLEPRGVGIDKLDKLWVTCKDAEIWRFNKNLTFEISSKFGTDHYVYNFFTSQKVPPIIISKSVNFGYGYKDVSQLTTFLAPLPIPSLRGEVISIEFKTW